MKTKFDQSEILSQDEFDNDPEVWDVILVGAGVAGATLAAVQGKLGRRVLVIERDLTQPNRIVGELLQPGGYQKLIELGLEAAVEEIDATKVCGYAFINDDKHTLLKYPKNDQDQVLTGRSFHHGRFVQKLRHLANEHKSVTFRQGIAKSLINGTNEDFQDGDTVCGVKYRMNGVDRCARADLTIVCDGMYSTLRKNFISPAVKHPSYFVGIIMHGCKLPYDNHGHVLLAKPSPLLFYPISSNEVRCLVDVNGSKLPNRSNGDLQKYMLEVVAPQVPEGVRKYFIKAVNEGEMRSVQNKQMSAQAAQHDGALIVGDAYNMRHPLTGGGMTVALGDCKVLCDMLSVHNTFKDVQLVRQTTSDFHLKRKPFACTINVLANAFAKTLIVHANALYEVVRFTEDQSHELMRQACFDYLGQGGMKASGPISILAGLNPRPMLLVVYFFLVAMFGMRQVLTPFSIGKVWVSGQLLLHASNIILPIIRDEGWNMLWSEIFVHSSS